MVEYFFIVVFFFSHMFSSAPVIWRKSGQPASHLCVKTTRCAARTPWTLTAAVLWPQSSTWMNLWPARSVVQVKVRRGSPCWTPRPLPQPLMACPMQSLSSINLHQSPSDQNVNTYVPILSCSPLWLADVYFKAQCTIIYRLFIRPLAVIWLIRHLWPKESPK